MKKRLLTSIVAFILVVSMGTVVALAAPAEDSQSERIGILYYGDDLKIVRANMPFANTSKGEYGTYFIGYASTISTTRRMLENMFIGSPAGNTDRLLDFSTAITGTLFFVPSYDLLG